MQRLILATHNQGKLREFAGLLGFAPQNMATAGELGLPEPEETGATFAENALIKARAAHKATGDTALADDSGLCVSALQGDPGIYSARWAGPHKDFAHAMHRVNQAMGQTSDRSAYFIATLALVLPDGSEHLFEGRVDGEIVWPPRGDRGHGYDPLFMPQGEKRTFAEMSEAEKNFISHRGNAIRLFQEWLKHNPLP